MKKNWIYFMMMIFWSCSSKDTVSKKEFPPISLINKIEFFDSAKDWDKIGCGFLIKYRADTFVVSAKHIISVVKTDSMKYLTLDGFVKKWSLRPLTREDLAVVVDKLLNADNTESLNARNRYENNWLVFSIRENHAKVQPLEIRETLLVMKMGC